MLLFTIKFVHSLILLYMLVCIGLIWHYGLTGRYRRFLPFALVSLVLEGLVWLGYGMRCPLTDWAIALGDDTGSDLLMDMLLVQPVNVVPGYAVLFVLGLVCASWRFWHDHPANVKGHNHS